MELFFADDSRQNNPSRPGMGPIVAIGGVCVSSPGIRELEHSINDCCSRYGFPPGEEFKWSPGSDLWMRKNLVDEKREQFFHDVFGLIKEKDGRAVVVMEDTAKNPATGGGVDAEQDVTRLFLERAESEFRNAKSEGLIITDRPGGKRADEDSFVAECLQVVLLGTRYVEFANTALVLTAASDLVRLLQVADVVTSCSTAFFSGESRYAPRVFESDIKPLLRESLGRIGGAGLKLHPDFRYANLYHWLLGDSYFCKWGVGTPLPLAGHPYCSGPDCE